MAAATLAACMPCVGPTLWTTIAQHSLAEQHCSSSNYPCNHIIEPGQQGAQVRKQPAKGRQRFQSSMDCGGQLLRCRFAGVLRDALAAPQLSRNPLRNRTAQTTTTPLAAPSHLAS